MKGNEKLILRVLISSGKDIGYAGYNTSVGKDQCEFDPGSNRSPVLFF